MRKAIICCGKSMMNTNEVCSQESDNACVPVYVPTFEKAFLAM